MTDEPNALTFDIADLFTGKAYPKDVVEVYTDEATAYDIYKAKQEVSAAQVVGDLDRILKAETALEALRKKAEPSRIRVHLTGVDRDTRKAVGLKNREAFPPEVDLLGREKQNIEADDAFVNDYWAVHIEAIERADGSKLVAPDAPTIKIFRSQAPDAAIAAIDAGIRELAEGSKAGFEDLVTEHDFLSRP